MKLICAYSPKYYEILTISPISAIFYYKTGIKTGFLVNFLHNYHFG
jgi:hypothetical protein